jgi:hypothetical protein
MSTEGINAVQKLYVAYFSRPADYSGLQYWVNVYDQNPAALQQMSHDFSTSAEYHRMYGLSSNRDIVNAVYEHLFGREAEQGGLDYWTPLLDNGAITIDNVVTKIAAGAQNNDLFAYNAKVAVATAFDARLDTPVEQSSYAGDAASKIAFDYLAQVKDLNSAASHMDPGAIDAVIAQIVASHSGGLGGTVVPVGVPDAPPPVV